MIDAHGTTLTVTESAIKIHYSGLSAALAGLTVSGDDVNAGAQRDIALSDVTDATLTAPTDLDPGWVELSGVNERVRFSAKQQVQAQRFHDDVTAALRGEAPSRGGVPGLNFVAVDVETANPSWGSVIQIGAVKYFDGVETDAKSWLCTPPENIAEFNPDNVAIHGITPEDVAGQPSVGERIGDLQEFIDGLPFVAHNAKFDATALRHAALATNAEITDAHFGCSLALARHSKLKVLNHRLPTVSKHLGVELTSHHDALADARAAGGIVVALASRQGHSGSLMELFHHHALTLGELSAQSVIPVLKDRSGAGRSLQAAGDTTATPTGAGGAGTDFRDSDDNTEPAVPRHRGPAPWQSVATPDTIPEPNAAADEDDPLYGQTVVLTGDFEPYDKGRLWLGIAEHGGQVAKNVTKKTTILVIGTWASTTSKEKKAEEYREKGQDIEFWDADKLYAHIGLDEEPPF